jgi:DNA-binding winged helix-turn-helix (wHTH) protein/TolB-like protein
MPTLEELNGGFNLGEWEILPARGVIRRGDTRIEPENKPYRVLMALACRDGEVVSKDELIEEVWEGKAFSDEPLLRAVSVLRGYFGDKRPFRYIGNIPKRGYRLLQKVELHVPAAPQPAAAPPAARSEPRWKSVAALVAMALLAALIWPFMAGQQPAVRSLAIMPLENLSGDPGNQWIVDGVRNTLAQRLTGLPEFTIKNARRSYDGEPSEIAAVLGVESLLFGDVQLQDGALRIGYEIVRGRDNVTLVAGEVAGSTDRLFQLQEKLASAIRDDLAGSETPELIKLVAPDSAAYNSYMRGMYALEHRLEGDNLEGSMKLFRQSIDLDESYGPAYLGLATAYALLPDYRGADLERHHDLAIATIEKGITMAPSIADPAGAIYGFVYHQQKRWRESEASYRRAVNAPVVDSNAFNWYSRMLASVGRLDEALDMALAAEHIDPGSNLVNSRIAMVYTWLNNPAKAHEYFDRANDLDATGIIHVMAHSLLLWSGGQQELSRNLTFAAVQMEEAPTDWIDPVYRALADPDFAAEALARIDRAWEQGLVIADIVLVVRTLLGDIDGAMAVAALLEQPGEAFSMELLFIPQLRPLREHPGFMPLLERLGIVAYWADARCSWANDRVRCEP